MFAIVPAAASAALAGATAADLTLDRHTITPQQTDLSEPVTVSAQLVSHGASPEATVWFSDGDPLNGGEVFDAEFLPYIRAGDTYLTQVTYTPQTCGRHDIFAELAGVPHALGDVLIAVVDVGIDTDAVIRFLIDEVRRLDLNFPGNTSSAHKQNIVRDLDRPNNAFSAAQADKGISRLEKFDDTVAALKHKGRISPDKADFLIAQSDQIIGCLRDEGLHHMPDD